MSGDPEIPYFAPIPGSSSAERKSKDLVDQVDAVPKTKGSIIYLEKDKAVAKSNSSYDETTGSNPAG